MVKKKAGPFPVWLWFVIIGAGGYLLYRHYTSSASTAASTFDPNAVDPATGLTYGQEAGLTPTTGASTDGGGGSSGSGSGGGPTGGQEVQGAMSDIAVVEAMLKMMEQIFATVEKFRHQVTGTSHGKGQHKPSKPRTPHGWTTGGKNHRNLPGTKPKKGSQHRAPAHPNENTAHQAHSHVHHKQPNPSVRRPGPNTQHLAPPKRTTRRPPAKRR